MNHETIKLSTLFEEVISDFIKRHPGIRANFEIENRFTVHGDYTLWRNAIESLIEYMVNLSTRATCPAIVFGRIGDESIYVVLDDGSQFETNSMDTLLTVSLHKQLPPGMIHVKRIVIKKGGHIWDIQDNIIDGAFNFSFN